MNQLTILTLSTVAVLGATSPIHYVSNYKNHNGTATGYQYLVKHHKINRNNKTKHDSYKLVTNIENTIYKGENMDEKNNNTFNNYLNLKPIIERIIPDQDFFDNTDPRNDEGQWEILGIGNDTKQTTAGGLNDSLNNDDLIYRNDSGDLNDVFRDDKEVNKVEEPVVSNSNNNNDTNLKTETTKSGVSNDFFKNNTKVSKNSDPKKPNKDVSGELNNFFINETKVNKNRNPKKLSKDISGELNNFFRNDKEAKKNSIKQTKVSFGELHDFLKMDKEVNKTLKKENKDISGDLNDYFKNYQELIKNWEPKKLSKSPSGD